LSTFRGRESSRLNGTGGERVRWRTENPGEENGTIMLVVDQVDEWMIGVEDGGLGGSAGAEGEDRGGRGRSGSFLSDFDAGSMNGIAEM